MVMHGRVSQYPRAPREEVAYEEEPTPAQLIKNLTVELKKSWGDFANLLEDQTHRVSEYRVQTLAPDTNTSVSLQPEYEVSEIITAVIVVGPTATPAFTLKLGKRVWNLVLPASQILVIAPVSFALSRSDDRLLTSLVSGDWSLELNGFADYTESYRTLA